MKIAIMSDLHLGFRQYGSTEREEDFYNQFNKVCQEINKSQADLVIIAGDLFNTPNPSPAAINAYRKGIKSLQGKPVCSIKGNHTMVRREDHFSIDKYFGDSNEFKDYYYLDDNSVGNWAGLHFIARIDGITYRGNSEIEEFIEIQKQFAKEKAEGYRILIVHQSFKEFCGFIGEELSIEDIDYKPYDLIICGHIHSRLDTKLQDGTIFIQPGSIERMNTTEAKDEIENGKGFYLINTETNEVEFHKVECDRKFLLGEYEITTTEKLQEHLKDIKKQIKELKLKPIISYKYKGKFENIQDNVKEIEADTLMYRYTINTEEENDITIEITDTEIPTILEAIKEKGKKEGLTKNEINLAIDLHKSLSTGDKEDSQGIIDTYYEKNRKKETNTLKDDEELDEIIEYFDQLEKKFEEGVYNV